MSATGVRYLPNPGWNINKIDADIALKITKALDTAPQGRNWRAVVTLATTLSPQFKYSQLEIEGFGMAVNQSHGSPASKLWRNLASRGFTVQHLIQCLDGMGWEALLLDLKPYERITLLSSPPDKVKLHEGDSLTLSVTATGFPYPRYQWFQGNKPVPGAMESTLTKSNVRKSDEGSYCCRLHNSADLDKVMFTEYTAVTVRQNPQQVCWPDPTPAEKPVNLEPVIVNQTQNITISDGDSFVLRVQATGTDHLEYRWLKNGNHLPCISPEYTVDRATVIDSGSYECCVENRYGKVRSNAIRVQVWAEPKAPSAIKTGRQTTHIENKPYMNTTSMSSLDIVSQPRSCSVEKGGSALFTCGATGRQPIRYQWFKDGHIMPGETADQLALRVVNSYDQEGCFQCQVTNELSQLISSPAYLKLDLELPAVSSPVGTVYTATDKVALLIGNYDYTGTDTLKAPKTDVLVLAEMFRSLDFKVVSLLNLTLEEMKAAVAEFCKLLCGEAGDASGVYGVFYFCGHGIEETGQCYLVPQDAPTGFSSSHCLCAQEVLSQIQSQKAALCTMILDCCRIRNDNPPDRPLRHFVPWPMGNFVYLYATTEGMRAYEYDERNKEPNGILVKHLQRHLCKRKSVETIFSRVREDISADDKLRRYQIPEVKTNLSEPGRSLADKIRYTGHTEVYDRRTQRWLNAHRKPENCFVSIPHLGVTVYVEYQADFSNVMSVYLTVKNPGRTRDCYAWIVNLPPTLSIMQRDVRVIGHSPSKTKIVIQDFQKLKEPLTLTISLQYRMDGDTEYSTFEHGPLELGFPLVSTLNLWQGDTSSHRVPIEHYQGDDGKVDPYYVNMPQSLNSPQPSYANCPPPCLPRNVGHVNIGPSS